MATYQSRNGHIRAQVHIKPLRRQTKTFGTMEAARAWADKTEAALRSIRSRGMTEIAPAVGYAMPRKLAEVAALPRIPASTVFCGIYFLFSGDECVYVGKSLNVHSRAFKHALDAERKDFDAYAWVPCAAADIDAWELYYIKLLAPRHNVAGRPNYAERIAILRETNELTHRVAKSLGSIEDLPESVQSIMGAMQKR